MDYRVAAYITSYEDLEALLRCISSIQSQSYPVEKIYIIENSKVDHVSSLALKDVIVEHCPENIGISGGLRRVIPWAIEKQYDFLWTFDQDSEPEQDCLSVLLDYYDLLIKMDHRVGLILPKVVDSATKEQLNGAIYNGYRFVEFKDHELSDDYYECDAVITSGSLVSVKAAATTELPNENLFIDAVDWDYCMKLKEKKYSIFVANKAILMHRFGKAIIVQTILKKREINIHSYSALRYFYMTRNHTYVETRLARANKRIVASIIHRMQCLVYLTVKILFYDRQNSFAKLQACYLGTFYGLTGQLKKEF